jgi:tripartite ATP-independent transporter DctM subunit
MDIADISITFIIGLGLLLIGIPIAAVMVGLGAVGGFIIFGPPFIQSIGNVVWGVQNENILTAIPLFVLMGEILLRAGIADRMYNALSIWLGRLPGGLLHTNIGCCSLFAATTGSSLATAAYAKSQSLGSLAAGGTLGILIPPSIALLIYGSLTNNSISQLFVAGVIPGILLTACFMLYIAVAHVVSGNGRIDTVAPTWGERLRSLRALLPPVIIFVIVMGSIYFGIATPTESASLGVITALVFAGLERKLSFEMLHKAFVRTAQLTGMILLIIVGAFVLNLTLSLLGVAQIMTKWVVSLDLSLVSLLLVMIGFYLILGCFLEVLSIQVATIPISYPIVTAAGGDPIWFGIFIVLMSEIAMITPPVGMNLYVVQGVRSDHGDISEVMRGTIPFVAIMLAFTVLMIAYPEIALWLPGKMLQR